MGQARKSKSAAAHLKALLHVVSSSALAWVGWIRTPEILPVFVRAYQPTKIEDSGLFAKTRHRSRWDARVSHCFSACWTTSRPSCSQTRAKASCATMPTAIFCVVSVQRHFDSSASSDLHIRVQKSSPQVFVWAVRVLGKMDLSKFDTIL